MSLLAKGAAVVVFMAAVFATFYQADPSRDLGFFGERFPLLDIPLNQINNKAEAQHGGEIMEDPKLRVEIPRGVIVMEQDTNHDEAIVDFPAQENRADTKRENVEVNKRNRNNEMVCISDRAKRPQDQYEWQPRRSICGHLLPQKRPQRSPFAKTAQLRGRRFSGGWLY